MWSAKVDNFYLYGGRNSGTRDEAVDGIFSVLSKGYGEDAKSCRNIEQKESLMKKDGICFLQHSEIIPE